MGGKYICQYRFNEGEVCGRGCRHLEGCYIHRKRHQRPLCKVIECELPTTSKHGLCKFHVNPSYSKEYYHRKKLNKMRKNGQTVEALEQALDKIAIKVLCKNALEKSDPVKN